MSSISEPLIPTVEWQGSWLDCIRLHSLGFPPSKSRQMRWLGIVFHLCPETGSEEWNVSILFPGLFGFFQLYAYGRRVHFFYTSKEYLQ